MVDNINEKNATKVVSYILKKSDEYAIAKSLFELSGNKITPFNKEYINNLLSRELYFQKYSHEFHGGRGLRRSGNIYILGRNRALYLGKHRKQYVKIKGKYEAVSILKKTQKMQPK